MKIAMLGPFSAAVNGVRVAPTAHKPRQLLALLAVHIGQVVPVGTVVEEIWGADAAPKAHMTVQTYVLQLRNLIAGALGIAGLARELLVTRPGGYALLAGEDAVDAHTHDRLCAAAQLALEDGDDARAAALFREALALWRGPALSGLPAGSVLGIEAMRLEQSRTAATERCLAAELRLGAHERLLPELHDLTARHPHNEELHGLLMTALDRSGQRARALAVYAGVRTRLDEAYGLLPSPRLRRLEREMYGRTPAPAHRG